MYQALLTRKYLTSKVMPLLAVLAVTVCTTTPLVVWSIMGGFLVLLLSTGRGIVGDVMITWPTVGFAHYDDLVTRLEQDDLVAGATPVIEGFGLLTLPDNRVLGVQIMGVDPDSFARVTEYEEALWWRPLDEPLPKDDARADPRLGTKRGELARRISPEFDSRPRWEEYLKEGLQLQEPDPETGQPRDAAVLGIELGGFSLRQPQGWYEPAAEAGRRTESGTVDWFPGFMADQQITLSVLPMDRRGRAIEMESRRFPVANEFRSGIFEIDSKTIILPLTSLQQMLKMDQAVRVRTDPATDPFAGFEPAPEAGADRPETGEQPGVAAGQEGKPAGAEEGVEVEPARVTTVLVKAVEGVKPEELRNRCVTIYRQFAAAHPGEVPNAEKMDNPATISTWERQQAMFIAAVEKETALVMGIVIFISFVVSFLILAIFWSMVSEKTRDIGVLRALGASRAGVAGLWLGYGLVIGLLGSVLGVAGAYAIVWNINPIHDWLGRAFGLTIWDPQIYYLFEIPNKVVPWKAGTVFAGGLFFSVMGALIPALRAAFMDPVKALRFE